MINENTANWTVYQPLIVGLGAVILATLGNTCLEWFKQSLTHRHAADALRRALIAELQQALDTSIVNKDRANEPDEGGHFLVPIQEHFPIYDHLIGSLGLLQIDEVSAVVNAYGRLRAQLETIPIMGRVQRVEGTVLQAIIDAKWSHVLAAQAGGMAEAIRSALAVLRNKGHGSGNGSGIDS